MRISDWSSDVCSSDLLESPHYTRPEQYQGVTVPQELLSGHHANIAVWRRRQSLALTAARRPDLILQARPAGLLSKADEKFLKELRPASATALVLWPACRRTRRCAISPVQPQFRTASCRDRVFQYV